MGCPIGKYPKYTITTDGNEFCCDSTMATNQDLLNYINSKLTSLIDRVDSHGDLRSDTINYLIYLRNWYIKKDHTLNDTLQIPAGFISIDKWFIKKQQDHDIILAEEAAKEARDYNIKEADEYLTSGGKRGKRGTRVKRGKRGTSVKRVKRGTSVKRVKRGTSVKRVKLGTRVKRGKRGTSVK